jgi:hypothetical protein
MNKSLESTIWKNDFALVLSIKVCQKLIDVDPEQLREAVECKLSFFKPIAQAKPSVTLRCLY